MRYLLTLALCFCMLFSRSQTGNILGKITDSSGKKVLPLTTVTIFKAKDTSIITYRLSNETGEFKIPGLPYNVPLRLMATFSGYEAFRKDFSLNADAPTFNFGNVKLIATSKQLDEVIVTSERPPVVIKQDTIEFNASAFKTLPNALVEDMLKKLPGVLVDADGNITVNGQKVNRILVDGKRFFGDDPKMATRNLPSNFIDKIQVVDDKEQMAQNNDGDMSNIGKVINLTLKKGVKKGWFGKLYAGLGTDDRYEAGGIANIYRDTLQLSLVGLSNNVNRSGFSFRDITQLGGFDRSGISSISLSSGSGREGLAVNGFNFGGIGNGLTTTSGLGFNLNHAPTKNLSVFVQYFYGRTKNEVVSENNTARFIGDTTLNTRLQQNAVNIGNSHTVSTGVDWKKDTLTNMNFRLGYSHNDNTVNSPSLLTVNNNKLGLLSRAQGVLYSDATSDVYNQSMSISHKFKGKRNRNLYISESLEHTTNPNYNTTESINEYYYPVVNFQPFNQLRATKSPSTSLYVTANYSDALSKVLTLRFNNRINYRKNEQDIFTYGKYSATNKYDSINYTLSNSLQREQTRWNSDLGLAYRINKVTVNVGASLLQQWINNSFSVNASANSVNYHVNLLPVVSISWRRNTFSFNQDVNAPDIRYLVPVPDNSNPFNIVYGNPALQPTKRTSFNWNSSYNNVKTNLNINTNANVYVTDNAVIQSVVINSNGVQTNTPVNANGVWSSSAYLRVSKQYKNQQKFFVTVDGTLSGNMNQSPIYYNNIQSKTTGYGFSPSVGAAFNWHDVVEFNPRYFPNFIKNVYANAIFQTTDVVTHNVTAELIVRLPRKIIWESNVNYRYNSQVAVGLPKDNLYWYAAVSLLMLKDDKGQLKLAAYDILNKNNAYYRFINANSVVDSRSNVLQRYFALSFVYNVRPSGAQKQKVGGKQNTNMFLF